MEIKTEREDGILIANVNGRVDSANAREFENVLSSAISDDDSSVVVDFGGLSYISSSGLRVILLVAKSLRNRNAEFALCSLSGPIGEVFKISGFDKIISIYDSQAEARAALGG